MAETLTNLQIESLPDGGYLATSADLPGLVAQGRTITECVEIAQDVRENLWSPTSNAAILYRRN